MIGNEPCCVSFGLKNRDVSKKFGNTTTGHKYYKDVVRFGKGGAVCVWNVMSTTTE